MFQHGRLSEPGVDGPPPYFLVFEERKLIHLHALPGVRRLAWRLGRRLYALCRRDGANDPRKNGEYWLLRQIFAGELKSRVFFDVGANQGDWTSQVLEYSRQCPGLAIHAFEPSRITRERLASRFQGRPLVRIEPFALSEREGLADFFSERDGGGTNSLSPISGGNVERVQVTTLDRYMELTEIQQVSFVKIDAEGFDLMILRGAESALAGGRIDVVQFEYNWRWILNHSSLRDVFEFIAGKPYRFGKLTGDEIEFYRSWHPELDRYFENNYVLVRQDGLSLPGREAFFDRTNTIRFDQERR